MLPYSAKLRPLLLPLELQCDYLYEQFKQCGATIIGEWATEGYNFQASKAVVDGYFVGLALDQENQKDLTPDRLDNWLKMLAKAWD